MKAGKSLYEKELFDVPIDWEDANDNVLTAYFWPFIYGNQQIANSHKWLTRARLCDKLTTFENFSEI